MSNETQKADQIAYRFFSKLALVVHAGLPVSAASLLHRCGRGQGGAGVLVVARHDRRRAEALARRAGFSLDWD